MGTRKHAAAQEDRHPAARHAGAHRRPTGPATTLELQSAAGNRAAGALITEALRRGDAGRPHPADPPVLQRSFLDPPRVSQSLGEPSSTAGHARATLVDTIRELAIRYETLETKARSASLKKRLRILDDIVKHLTVADQKTGDSGIPAWLMERTKQEINLLTTVTTAYQMRNQLHWVGSDPSSRGDGMTVKYPDGTVNAFANWMMGGQDTEPGLGDGMNCWEAILFTAYRAGLVDRAHLQGMHREALQKGREQRSPAAYRDHLQTMMTSGEQRTFSYTKGSPGTPDIPAGSLVFIKQMTHVVLATGAKTPKGSHVVLSNDNWKARRDKTARSDEKVRGDFRRSTLERELDYYHKSEAMFALPRWA